PRTRHQSFEFEKNGLKAKIRIWKNFLRPEATKRIFMNCALLSTQGFFKAEEPYGKPTLRKSAAFGDPDARYKYKGATRPANPWPDWLQAERVCLKDVFSQDFELVLINQYPCKQSGVGAHSDIGGGIVPRSTIACINVGATRTLQLSDKESGVVVRTLILQAGSMYSMELDTQEILLHEILAGEHEDGPRYSLTFRHVRILKRKNVNNDKHKKKRRKSKNKS